MLETASRFMFRLVLTCGLTMLTVGCSKKAEPPPPAVSHLSPGVQDTIHNSRAMSSTDARDAALLEAARAKAVSVDDFVALAEATALPGTRDKILVEALGEQRTSQDARRLAASTADTGTRDLILQDAERGPVSPAIRKDITDARRLPTFEARGVALWEASRRRASTVNDYLALAAAAPSWHARDTILLQALNRKWTPEEYQRLAAAATSEAKPLIMRAAQPGSPDMAPARVNAPSIARAAPPADVSDGPSFDGLPRRQ